MNIRKVSLFTAIVFAVLACGIIACHKDKDSSSSAASVSALTCGSAVFSANATINVAYSGIATIAYTGGNAISYATGSAISSSGVTGLTATLQAGTLASGAGSLTYAISGTPTATGTAAFAISFGGQSCTLSLPVNSASTASCSSQTGVAKIVCLAKRFCGYAEYHAAGAGGDLPQPHQCQTLV